MTTPTTIVTRLLDAGKPDARAFIHKMNDPEAWPWPAKLAFYTPNSAPWVPFRRDGDAPSVLRFMSDGRKECYVIPSLNHVCITRSGLTLFDGPISGFHKLLRRVMRERAHWRATP